MWATRFETVARAIAAMMPECARESILDIGTGTGIVAAIFSDVLGMPRIIAGCDLSREMLRQAKARLPALHVVVADATALPFRNGSFDLATSSFVLSHVQNYRNALQEVRRVLKPSGLLAVSNWTPATDEYNQTWREYLADVISKREAERAVEEVAPHENYFSEEGNLQGALSESAFSVVHSGAVDLPFQVTIEQFIEDREINSGGRLGRHLLGTENWAKFRTRVMDVFHARFGDSIQFSRRALIVIGRKSRG